jgi:hypothetical protein
MNLGEMGNLFAEDRHATETNPTRKSLESVISRLAVLVHCRGVLVERAHGTPVFKSRTHPVRKLLVILDSSMFRQPLSINVAALG